MASVSSQSREHPCWCGCGQAVEQPRLFAPGHDRWAESYVIRKQYGSIAEFLTAHGYGPHGRNARKEAARSAATSTESPRILSVEGNSGGAESKPEPFAGFDEERRTYESRKTELLRDEGKYVLIKGEIVAGIWPVHEQAVEAGYRRFGLQPFYVKQILAVDPVVLVNRDVLPCPT